MSYRKRTEDDYHSFKGVPITRPIEQETPEHVALSKKELELRGKVESLQIQKCNLATIGAWGDFHRLVPAVVKASRELVEVWKKLYPELYVRV